MLSRETAFLTQNVLFLVVTFAILLGTIFPMISEWVTGDKISLNAPYFNRVAGPLMLALLLLMGAAPLLAWRRSAFTTLRRNFLAPILAAVISIPVLYLLGNRNMGGFVGVAAMTFVFAGILQEYIRGVRARRQATGEPVGTALVNLVKRNGRRYGGYVVHIGVLLITLGIIGDTFYQQEGQANLRVGESMTVANYTLTYNKMDPTQGPNYTEFAATLDLAKNGRPNGQILATKNIYDKNAEQPMTEVGLRVGPIEDVYVVLAGFDNMGETAAFKVYINPLMSWMWIGGLVMILGVLISAWPRRSPATAEARARVPGAAQPASLIRSRRGTIRGYMLFIVLAILLTAAALLAVAYPILSKGSAAKPATTAQESLDELLGQRDAAMQALRELNFDHRMGKISDEDFAVFELNLKQHAAETLRALDEWEAQTEDDLDQSLEREIAARRVAVDLRRAARARPADARPLTTISSVRSAARRWPRRLPRPFCPPKASSVPNAAGAPIPMIASAPAAGRRCTAVRPATSADPRLQAPVAWHREGCSERSAVQRTGRPAKEAAWTS